MTGAEIHDGHLSHWFEEVKRLHLVANGPEPACVLTADVQAQWGSRQACCLDFLRKAPEGGERHLRTLGHAGDVCDPRPDRQDIRGV